MELEINSSLFTSTDDIGFSLTSSNNFPNIAVSQSQMIAFGEASFHPVHWSTSPCSWLITESGITVCAETIETIADHGQQPSVPDCLAIVCLPSLKYFDPTIGLSSVMLWIRSSFFGVILLCWPSGKAFLHRRFLQNCGMMLTSQDTQNTTNHHCSFSFPVTYVHLTLPRDSTGHLRSS